MNYAINYINFIMYKKEIVSTTFFDLIVLNSIIQASPSNNAKNVHNLEELFEF